MSNLSYKEKMSIQFMRNKSAGLQPTSQRAIANKFGLSAMYVNTVINGKQHGKKSNEWRKKFAAYAGMEDQARRCSMKIKITGKPEKIKKLLNAIGGSKEQLVTKKELKQELKNVARWRR